MSGGTNERTMWGRYVILEGVASIGGFVTLLISCAQVSEYGADGLRLGLIVAGAFLAAGGSAAVVYGFVMRQRAVQKRLRALARARRGESVLDTHSFTYSSSARSYSKSGHRHA